MRCEASESIFVAMARRLVAVLTNSKDSFPISSAVVRVTLGEPPVVVGHSLGGIVATISAAMGVTGPVICADQPLTLEGFAEIVHRLAPRHPRETATYADAIMEEKLALGMGLVPQPLFGELERKARTSDQNVVLDIWKPMLDWDSDAIDAAKPALGQLLQVIDAALSGRARPTGRACIRKVVPKHQSSSDDRVLERDGALVAPCGPGSFRESCRDFLSQPSET